MDLRRFIPDKWKQEFKIKLGAPHMYWSINNMKRNGLRAETILDIGAYEGDWTSRVKRIFPDAHFVMIEANPEKRDILNSICRRFKKVDLEMALLASEGNVSKEFSLAESASSLLEELNETGSERITLTSSTLDEVLSKRGIGRVDFMKLDVQGYELEVLKGAHRYLQLCECVLLEVSLIALHKDCPVLADVVSYMDRADYCAYDICSVSARRPYDRALWQTDIIFVKKNSQLLSSRRYS